MEIRMMPKIILVSEANDASTSVLPVFARHEGRFITFAKILSYINQTKYNSSLSALLWKEQIFQERQRS